MTTGTVMPSHWHSQHNLVGDVTLPSGKILSKLEWENNCCGLACLQTVLDSENLPAPSLEHLLVEGIESGAYLDDKGWIFQGLLSLGRNHGLDGMVIPDAPIDFVEGLPSCGVAPIVSVHCGFPQNPPSKGGHLVVFRGIQVANRSRRICFFDDPSTQGTNVSNIEETRFWSSFSGRVLLMKHANTWQRLNERVEQQYPM